MSAQEWLSSGGRPLFFDGVRADDPLRPQKRALLVALGADESASDGQWVDVKPLEAQCLSMAPLLRLAHVTADGTPADQKDGADGAAGERWRALAEWRAEPAEVWNALQRPVGAEIERRVAAQVIGACEGALASLPGAAELADAAREPEGQEEGAEEAGGERAAAGGVRARFAARVPLGERSALEACASVWRKAAAAAGAV